VVIGFVISYRALSGYERYWMGRTVWSDIIRNCRTAGRVVWYHIPARLSPKTAHETELGHIERTPDELLKAMAEKRMALDLVEG
jgi:ion channel-forming bestrophin family protein